MAVDLGALLKDVPKFDTGREQIEYIHLDLIDDDTKNFYATDEIESLARNIATVGLLDPLRIRDNPEAEGRYKVVSGHRRRLALKLLVQDDPAQWGEVACIYEKTAASPALQQLRLIFANADNRKMSPADVSKQAAQVKELLYRLKEEEGYEFPGRMRDHVAEIVKVSKSKLARLEAIDKKLSAAWQPSWKDGTLPENTAYELSKMPKACQNLLFEEKCRTGANLKNLYASDVEKFAERAAAIEKQTCSIFGGDCGNYENKMRKAAVADRYYGCSCDSKCCRDCNELLRCQRACPRLKETIKKLKADAKEAAKQEAAAKEEKDRPAVEKISALWQRFGLAREMAFKEFDDCKKAMGIHSLPYDSTKMMQLECGEAKIDASTYIPYGYAAHLSDIAKLTRIADLFDCSLDWLLCRTDVKEMAQEGSSVSESGTEEPQFIPGAWYPASVEPPVGVSLILIDSGGYVDTGKYKGCGEYTMDFGDPVVLWTLFPQEKDVAAAPPAVTGWQIGHPDAYGTYAAYVQVTGAANPMLRELLWYGEEWLMFGQKIIEDVTVQCWADRPDF